MSTQEHGSQLNNLIVGNRLIDDFDGDDTVSHGVRGAVESAAKGLALPPTDDKAESTVEGTRFGFVIVRFRILAELTVSNATAVVGTDIVVILTLISLDNLEGHGNVLGVLAAVLAGGLPGRLHGQHTGLFQRDIPNGFTFTGEVKLLFFLALVFGHGGII